MIGNENDRTAALNVGTYTAVDAGTLINEGVFHADTIAALNDKNVIENRNEFSAGSMDWTGKFTNTANAEIDELTLRDDRNVNKEGATMTLGTLTVAGDGTSGDDGSLSVRGGLTNKGTLTVQNDTTVEGDLINEDVFTGNKVAVAGINGTFANSGTATLDSLSGNTGSTVSNAEAGLLKILGANTESNLAGTLNNAGTIEIEGTQKVALADGTLTNNGTIQSANENLSVEGGTLSNLGKALLNGISVTAGQIVNAVQAVFQDKGTTTVNTASADDVAVKNEGVLEVTDLQLQKGVIQGGTVGTKENTSATVGTEGKISSENVAMKTLDNEGTVEVTGTFEVASTENSGDVSVGADGTLVSNEGDVFTNKETGTLTSEGQVNLNGELINKGTTDIAQLNIGATGTLTAEADTALSNVNATEGAAINANNGAITVANLTAEGAVYNQTGGTFNAEKGWFNNSTLNIMGGVLDASQVKDADGNVTGLLGKNEVNISGANTTPTINNEDAPEIKNQYKDNLTQVIAGTVTSDTTVNIMQGGVLDVENIDLDGTTANSINLKGGVLQTSADQIFGSVTTEAVRLDATDAETGTFRFRQRFFPLQQ